MRTKSYHMTVLIVLSVTRVFSQICEKPTTSEQEEKSTQKSFVIVIHGGAGNITKGSISAEEEKMYIETLNQALEKGAEILEKGGTSVDAVERAIIILEDSPLFNAGKGSVFTRNGKIEMDASIMDGKTLKAGAVAFVGDIKNPISAARKVMENSEHVLLAGKGASIFARQQDLEIVDSSYFFTQKRWEQLQKILKQKKESGEKDGGTVGCVALDKYGNLAAGTSTGGLENKKHGRVGDSPIIGAGTYANNHTCAISCTGIGEYIMRYLVSYDISALMEYKNFTLKEVAEYVILDKLVKAGGEVGMIGVDKQGNIAMVFNTPGMFRGYIKSDGTKEILLYK